MRLDKITKSEDGFNPQKYIKKKLFLEYLMIFCTVIIMNFFMPILTLLLIGDNTGIDSLGTIFIVALLLRLFKYLITIVVFIIMPIMVLKSCKEYFKNILPKFKRFMYYFIILVPIFFSLLTLLEIPIANYIHEIEHETSVDEYSVDYENYKTPLDFQNELKNRGLIYDKSCEKLLNELNTKYYVEQYEEALLMTSYNNSFYDEKNEDKIINFDSNKKAPVYIYNSLLYLPTVKDKLQYAPMSMYYKGSGSTAKYDPLYRDYYIGCKIIYVDGDIYAIIGLQESLDITRYFDEHKQDLKHDFNLPFNMILSEKDKITTFVKDKYHPDGSIVNGGYFFEMEPNSKYKYDFRDYFPIRKVDKLDVNTINNIAIELQEGILKESIKYHEKRKIELMK